MTKVSIITPTFNRADVLGRAIESVQKQTFTDAEHLIIDDGSTDNTLELIDSYNKANPDIPIRTIELDSNQGANVARNHGLAIAQGKYVTFLDSDDQYLPRRVEMLVNALEGTTYIGATHQSNIILQNGIEQVSQSPTGEIVLEDLRGGNLIGPLSSTIFTRDVVDNICGFDTEFPASQDYDLYIRALERGSMIGLDEPLLRYYRREDAISADPSRKVKAQSLLWEKHSEKLSEEQRAGYAYSLGHQYATSGNMKEARRYFKQSLLMSFSPLVLYHFILSFLGKNIFDWGVVFKRQCYARLGTKLR